MVEPAASRDPLERYGAIEKAYCEEHWSTVIQDGQDLLNSLAGAEPPVPDGLRERLELLMAHAYLYGFGDRDSAEDLYQAVLHSGAETSLRQIAEQGLQHCNRPAAMPAAQPEPEADVEPRSPGPEAAAADVGDPSQAAFWQDAPQTVESQMTPAVAASWEAPVAATAAASAAAVPAPTALAAETGVSPTTAVSETAAGSQIGLQETAPPAAGLQSGANPPGEPDPAAPAWLSEAAPPTSSGAAAAHPVMPWLEEADPGAAAGLSPAASAVPAGSGADRSPMASAEAAAAPALFATAAAASGLVQPAQELPAGPEPSPAAMAAERPDPAGSDRTGLLPADVAAVPAAITPEPERPLAAAAGDTAPLGGATPSAQDGRVAPEGSSGTDPSLGVERPADAVLPAPSAEQEPAASLALSMRPQAAAAEESSGSEARRPGSGPEQEAILIPEVVEEPELLEMRVSDPDLMVELQERLQERLAAIRSGKGRQPRDDGEPADPSRSSVVLEKGPVVQSGEPLPGAFEPEAAPSPEMLPDLEAAAEPDSDTDAMLAAAGRPAATSDVAIADQETGADGLAGSLDDSLRDDSLNDNSFNDNSLEAALTANDSGSGISFLGYGRRRERTPGPFAAPPVPVAEEEAEMLMGLLKVEMG